MVRRRAIPPATLSHSRCRGGRGTYDNSCDGPSVGEHSEVIIEHPAPLKERHGEAQLLLQHVLEVTQLAAFAKQSRTPTRNQFRARDRRLQAQARWSATTHLPLGLGIWAKRLFSPKLNMGTRAAPC